MRADFDRLGNAGLWPDALLQRNAALWRKALLWSGRVLIWNLLLWSLAGSLLPFMHLPAPGELYPSWMFNVVFLLLSGLAALWVFRPATRGAVLVVLAVFYTLAVALSPDFHGGLLRWSADIQNYAGQLAGQRLVRIPALAGYTVTALYVLLTGIAGYQGIRCSRLFWPLLITFGTLVFEWIWIYDPAYPLFWRAAGLGMVWLLLERLNQQEGEQIEPAGQQLFSQSFAGLRQLGWGLLLGLIAIGSVALLPLDRTPVSLGDMGRTLNEYFPVLQGLRGASPIFGQSRDFDLGTVGWSESNAELGGPIRPSNTPVLDVRLQARDPYDPNGLPEYVLLRGSVYDRYTGQGWVKSDTVEILGDFSDNPEPARAGSTLRLADHDLRIEVRVLNLNTETLFHIWEPTAMDPPGVRNDEDVQIDTLGNLTWDRQTGRGDTYASLGRWLDRESYEAARDRTHPASAPSLYLRPQIPESYLELPAGVAERVRELARGVTAEARTDLARAMEIERFLRLNFRYTLDAPAAPPGEDFVDFFLFEAQEGYCVYYASAMAVMLRSVDIPARWVTGFRTRVPSDGSAFTVQSSDAHAWVEAYVEPYGWLTFDPTPGGGIFYRGEADADDELIALNRGLMQELLDEPTEQQEEPAGSLEEQVGTSRPAFFPWGSGASSVNGFFFLLFLLGLMLAAGGSLVFFTHRLEVPAGGPLRQAGALFRRLERVSRRYGVARNPAETEGEFIRRLGQEWPALRPDLERFLGHYQDAFYSPRGLTAEGVEAFRFVWLDLQEGWSREAGRLRHAWRRWLP